MNTYVVLLRGINVGVQNQMPMTELKECLKKLGCQNVSTYIRSGNVVLKSKLNPAELGSQIEAALVKQFKLDSTIIKVLVLTQSQLESVIENKPKGFGDDPETYHSDVIFLMDVNTEDAIKVFKPREGVDTIWPGDRVIYSQRLSAKRTQSRLNRVMGTDVYKSMTIRNWNTTTKLLALMRAAEA